MTACVNVQIKKWISGVVLFTVKAEVFFYLMFSVEQKKIVLIFIPYFEENMPSCES
jgi:hypothetical protein